MNEPDADSPDDPLETPVKGLLRLKPCPARLPPALRRLRDEEGPGHEEVARYQQFEASRHRGRVLSRMGKPVDAQERTGLIWHTQGSGKSLTMISQPTSETARGAQEPAVLIVVDRRDLKTQLSDDFDACDYPNVRRLGVEDLKGKLRATGADARHDPSSPSADEYLARASATRHQPRDEAHRSQKGRAMRAMR